METSELEITDNNAQAQPPEEDDDDDDRVYFVPYRWWREARDENTSEEFVVENREGILYTASSVSTSYVAMKIINNIFNSDLSFNLNRDELNQNNSSGDEGVSGRDYALISREMWLQAFKWHSAPNPVAMDSVSFSVVEDDMVDVYTLQLRLAVARETNSLTVKISKKDNASEVYKRAYKIFNVEYETLRIWDFSGRTTLFSMNDVNKLPKDCQRQSDQEILLALQVYGLSDSVKGKDAKKDELANQPSKVGMFSTGSSVLSNGTMESNSFASSILGSSGSGSIGLTGLQNLGNTCFMNSALQCLAHTPKLVDYFLGDYSKEINPDNPLGMDGELATAFGDLIRKLWAAGASPVAPRLFKSKLAHFAPQFSGFNQHDSQELLAFLLDGLHEDLNRVKSKPYVEAKDADGRPDEEVADEYWRNHLARNDSIIVDVCHGQYRSTLVCPVCRKVSVTFDPLMYLSLPLPSTTMRTMTVTVLSTDGSSQPSEHTVVVPKYGKCKDLIQAVSSACSLTDNETLLVAEIYNHRVIRILEEPSDSLSLIRDEDQLAAYRLPKDLENSPLLVFMHETLEEHFILGKATSYTKAFGVPLIARLSNNVNGSDIRNLFHKLLTPFIKPSANASDDSDNTEVEEVSKNEVTDMEEDATTLGCDENPEKKAIEDSEPDTDFKFFLTDEKGSRRNESKIEMNDSLSITESTGRVDVHTCWPHGLTEKYDIQRFSSLPVIFKSGFFARKPQESVALYSCLESFLKEEPLGPEDMWFCPGCKQPRQAIKKLDLWRLPEILIIHLKRFSYSRFSKNKLETFVDFPIDDLDLTSYIACKNNQSNCRYRLYAISNHYGSLGGGHYTAFVYHGGNQWFDFDDSRVYPINGDKIKTSATYVLFYRRVLQEDA
ncbi:ubiquitinyl hydrolase 1 [Ranunculus cassubicifolius]